MTIERLSLTDGVDIHPTSIEDLNRQIDAIIHKHRLSMQALFEGEYDLTPEHWEGNSHRHELTVLENGTGLYYSVPIDEDAGYIRYGKNYKGGKVVQIPYEEASIVVSGQSRRDHSQITVFEIIRHKESFKRRKK